VLAAVSLAAEDPGPHSRTTRKRAITRAVGNVAQLLGNTPAIASRSYIDPRILDRYQSGWTIGDVIGNIDELDHVDARTRARLERAVLDLLSG
jgi:DNA topoisomerase IB